MGDVLRSVPWDSSPLNHHWGQSFFQASNMQIQASEVFQVQAQNIHGNSLKSIRHDGNPKMLLQGIVFQLCFPAVVMFVLCLFVFF